MYTLSTAQVTKKVACAQTPTTLITLKRSASTPAASAVSHLFVRPRFQSHQLLKKEANSSRSLLKSMPVYWY